MEPNVYRGDYTPLHRAVLGGQLEPVEELLAQGAHPNSEVLGTQFTALDLAVSEGATSLIPSLVRAGGRPGMQAWRYRTSPVLRAAVALLDEELERNRAVEVAQELALTPWRIGEAGRLLELGQAEEAEAVLEPVRGWLRDNEESLHLRIRALVANGHLTTAMEEACAVFMLYRDEGRYRQALMVAREMRKLDVTSPRPYELELRFLIELGCLEEAARCQEALLAVLPAQEEQACRARYRILLRTGGAIPKPRAAIEIAPSSWEGPTWFSEPGLNLPAPAAPSMEEWTARFASGRKARDAWQRYEELRGNQVVNVWEEYAPVAERLRASRRDLEGRAASVYVYPDDQSWSLAVLRTGEVVLYELG